MFGVTPLPLFPPTLARTQTLCSGSTARQYYTLITPTTQLTNARTISVRGEMGLSARIEDIQTRDAITQIPPSKRSTDRHKTLRSDNELLRHTRTAQPGVLD